MSDCGKKVYDKQGAMQIANYMERKHGDLMKAYLCPVCGDWHVGHPLGSGKPSPRSPGKSFRKNRRWGK